MPKTNREIEIEIEKAIKSLSNQSKPNITKTAREFAVKIYSYQVVDHLANPARIDYDICYVYPIIPCFMIERTFILYNYSPSSSIDTDILFNLAYYKFDKRISVLYNYYNSKNAIYEIFPIRIL
ncbi:hypothetical protein PCH_Pc21g13080 [Penicillium rubens Wisconsin 54-1255]|uniref:Uncharacterized protein n=1 Tax=Penicillium rubens (strain ATCC 28089 / DSM 1075 / NRRL 1951 / Wisconsin 54-1255) TaxID=500485 RepID=B6HMG1_PENRW|nr:hypothetical protein PCH_Pc21g13080 [Penicillium rubens Wisconsin 54-1255]